MKHTIAIAAFLAAGFTAWLPSQANAQVGVTVVIGHAPPPPRYEAVPRPRHGYLWVPGYWDWNGRNYLWIRGHWERARYGEVYRRPAWQHDRSGWRLDRGGWRAEGRNERPGEHHGMPTERHGPGDRYDHDRR